MDIKAFFTIGYGMYIVSSYDNEKINGQIANTIFQVTAEPPKITICINKGNLTYDFIKKSKVFSISVLSQEVPMKFIGLFGFKSGRDVDKFKNIQYKTGITKAPIILENSLSYFECELENSMDAGTHVLFIGKVVNAGVIKEGEPLTYSYYNKIKKGLSPKTAPTYIKKQKSEKKEVKGMKKYKCTVCGYIYDPEKGDPDSGVQPGTAFKDLPDDWTCPECGVGKDQFEVEE